MGLRTEEHQECQSFPHSPCCVPRTWLGSQQPPSHPKASSLQGKGKDIFGSFPGSFQKEMWDGLGPCVAGLGGNPTEQETSDITEENHGIIKLRKDL